MNKSLITILCIVFQVYSQDNTPKDSSCGKTLFISTVALESVALTGYLTATCFSFGEKKAAERETAVFGSIPFMGTYFLSSGIEKFVTLQQNMELKKEGKERYRGKSVFQLALYATSLLTGVTTFLVSVAEFFGGNEQYIASKTLMTTSFSLMVGQFVYDIYLYKKNDLLLKNDPAKLSLAPELKPYFGLSYKRDLQFGVKLYF
jgi:hypothetical protein